MRAILPSHSLFDDGHRLWNFSLCAFLRARSRDQYTSSSDAGYLNIPTAGTISGSDGYELKMVVFRYFVPFDRIWSTFQRSDDGDSKRLWSMGQFLLDYKAQCPWSLHSHNGSLPSCYVFIWCHSDKSITGYVTAYFMIISSVHVSNVKSADAEWHVQWSRGAVAFTLLSQFDLSSEMMWTDIPMLRECPATWLCPVLTEHAQSLAGLRLFLDICAHDYWYLI
jgi:hypothetical protein